MTTTQIKKLGSFPIVTDIDYLAFCINAEPSRVYTLIRSFHGEADSVTREALFQYCADKYHKGDYDVIYDRWLSDTSTEY